MVRVAVGVLVAVTVAVGAGGCLRVRPYQRELLADPAMAAPVWPALERIDDHTHEVSEGSAGATATGGGGCGCN